MKVNADPKYPYAHLDPNDWIFGDDIKNPDFDTFESNSPWAMLPTPITPWSTRFIDHIETSSWGEVIAMSLLVILVGVWLGMLFVA